MKGSVATFISVEATCDPGSADARWAACFLHRVGFCIQGRHAICGPPVFSGLCRDRVCLGFCKFLLVWPRFALGRCTSADPAYANLSAHPGSCFAGTQRHGELSLPCGAARLVLAVRPGFVPATESDVRLAFLNQYLLSTMKVVVGRLVGIADAQKFASLCVRSL